MNKNKVIAIILLVVIGTIVFWKREWIKKKLGLSKEPEAQSSTVTDVRESSSPKPIGIDYKENNTFPFKLGDKGAKVKAIQTVLNKLYKTTLDQDGFFGPQTETALVNAGFGKTLESTEVAKLLKKE
jgi:hypothetical protein